VSSGTGVHDTEITQNSMSVPTTWIRNQGQSFDIETSESYNESVLLRPHLPHV